MPQSYFRIKVKTSRRRRPAAKLMKEYKKQFQNVLRKVGMKGINNIKSEIRKRDLVNTGNLLNKVGYKMTPQGVRFEVRTDYASYLNDGVRKHKMVYLTKADKPIPIDVANGIFRWATLKGIRNGKWVHPGFRRGKGFIKAGVERTRETLLDELKAIRPKVFS